MEDSIYLISHIVILVDIFKLSFNLGSVKLTLPELGITETLGGMYEAFMSQ